MSAALSRLRHDGLEYLRAQAAITLPPPAGLLYHCRLRSPRRLLRGSQQWRYQRARCRHSASALRLLTTEAAPRGADIIFFAQHNGK